MLISKPTRTQMLEAAGEVPFEKGLYHNQAYEALVKASKRYQLDYACPN